MASADRTELAAPAIGRLRPEIVAYAVLTATLAVAAYTRFVGMGAESIWRDEAVSWMESRSGVANLLAATALDNYPPLHNLLLAGSMGLFGDSEWALRLPSALLGFANVVTLYWVGTILGGRKAGLIAAVLLTCSPFHVWYAHEARAYTLLALAATLFVGSALWLMQQNTLPRVVAVLAAAIVLLYSHPYGAFIWVAVSAAVLAVLVFRPSPDSPPASIWIMVQVAVALAFAPWAWVLAGRAHHIEHDGFWIAYPSPTFVAAQLRDVASGAAAAILLAVAAILAFVPLPARFGTRAAPPQLLIVATWLLSSLVIGVAISLVGTPIFIARYAIGSLPAFILLAALGLSRFAEGWGGGLAVAGAVAALCALAVAFGRPTPHEDWRSAVAYLAANLPADGCVLAPSHGYAYAFDYYARGRVACLLDAASGPVHIDSEHVAIVLTPEWSRRLLTYFDTPQWMAQTPLEFSGVEIFGFRRIR
jgi:uncharacterized membrane protein